MKIIETKIKMINLAAKKAGLRFRTIDTNECYSAVNGDWELTAVEGEKLSREMVGVNFDPDCKVWRIGRYFKYRNWDNDYYDYQEFKNFYDLLEFLENDKFWELF